MGRLRFLAGIITVVAACGGAPTLGDYAQSVETLVAEMNADLDASLDRYRAGPRTAGDAATFLEERVDARTGFLEAFAELTVPEAAEELAGAATVIVGELRSAEAALAEHARQLDSGDPDGPVWASPEATALEVADARAIELCQSAREAFNSPSREAFQGLYWVPEELQEVVNVAFQCTLEERGRS